MQFLRILRNFIPHWLVNYFFHLPLAFLAVIFYGYPARKLTVIGVTGTDGKTTTSTLIYEILREAGEKVVLIASVCAKIGSEKIDTGFHVTTPNPWVLQKLLHKIADKGFKFIVLETTSHGLLQHRLLGCNFKIGVMTNVTHEHLDYHKSNEEYLKAKAKLFKQTQFSILNKDDQSFDYLKEKAVGKIVTYGLSKADLTPAKFPFQTQLPGEFNRYNCLAAIAAAKTLGISDNKIRKAIADFKGVAGRMEVICEKPFKVVIDFAHTPNALKNALSTLKSMPHRKLIAVFGAAGLRDSTKRPLMGKVAGHLADKIILTAEDPRTEDVNEIINEVAKGCENKNKIIKEPNREKAIKLALALAQSEDIIGIFGKGHEQSMCFGEKEIPWSDRKAVKKALEESPSLRAGGGFNSLVAVILAAGKGKRMQATTVNKTVMKLAGKPMVGYTVEILKKAGIKKIVMVVGFAKDSIINFFKGKNLTWVLQKQQLGTAHAVKTALMQIPKTAKNILVIQGDDSAFYTPLIIKKLVSEQQQSGAAATFLTVKLKNPNSLGRIVRNKIGELKAIVEVKDATPSQLKIKEINTGCYCFKRFFLEKYLNKVRRNPISGEYYLPDLIKIGLTAKEKIRAVKIPQYYFQGVNTPEEWHRADLLMRQKLNVKR